MSNTIQVNPSQYLQGTSPIDTNKSIQILSSNNSNVVNNNASSTDTPTPTSTPTPTLTPSSVNSASPTITSINDSIHIESINNSSSTTKQKVNVKDLLTDEDNDKINNFIIRNAKFNLSNGKFPAYFGTNEEDFKIHRMVALRNKRIHSNPIYNTNEDVERKLRLQKEKEELKKRQQKLKEEKAKKAEKLAKESALKKKELESTSSLTNGHKSDSSLSTPVHENGSKSTAAKSSASTPLSWNSIGSNLKPNGSPSAALSTSTSVLSSTSSSSSSSSSAFSNNHASNASNTTIANDDRSVPSTSGSSLTSSTTPITQSSQSQSQSSSEYIPMDNTLKPLGLLLIKVMFDKKMISSITKIETENSLKPHGLINTGSICYMNAILQLLFSCEPFIKVLNFINRMTLPNFEKNIESKTPILDAVLHFIDLIKGLDNKNSKETLNPVIFYNSINKLPRFKHLKWGRQEDAEEFLGYLLDGLNEEFIESLMDTPVNEMNKLIQTISDTETKIKLMKVLEMIKGNSVSISAAAQENSNKSNGGWQEVNSSKKVSTLNSTVEVKPSPISLLFGGQFRSELESPNSKKASITLDPFMHIQLDIDDSNTNDLITAFNKFSEIERVSMNNQIAKKQNFIDKLPVVLIIHLKRFSYVYDDMVDSNGDVEYELVNKKKNNNGKNGNSTTTPPPPPPTSSSYSSSSSFGRIEKLHKKIKYDHEFNLPLNCISKTCINENNLDNNSHQPRYKLIGVVYHHGRSTDGGHYTCDVLNSNKWVRIDDNIITSDLKLEDVVENGLSGGNGFNNYKSAYLLMYQRIN